LKKREKNKDVHRLAASTPLLTRGRIVWRVEDLDDETLRAIEKAEVPAPFKYLDKKFKPAARGTR
jgi:hypothetical protein